MKLNLDPMPDRLEQAIVAVNDHFANLTGGNIHREIIWKNKREIAASVKAGNTPSIEFIAEAKLRNMDVIAFADLVLSKPDVIARREINRQTALLLLNSAKNPAELKAIITKLPTE